MPPYARSKGNKIEYLRKSLLVYEWSKNVIRNIVSSNYSFNGFVTALHEGLQLEFELKLVKSFIHIGINAKKHYFSATVAIQNKSPNIILQLLTPKIELEDRPSVFGRKLPSWFVSSMHCTMESRKLMCFWCHKKQCLRSPQELRVLKTHCSDFVQGPERDQSDVYLNLMLR